MRKLAWSMAGLSGAIFLAHYLLPATWLYWAILSMCVLFPLCWLMPREPKRRARLLTAGAALGFLCYALAVQTCLVPLQTLSTDEITVSARVTDYPVQFDYSTGVTVRITEPGLDRLQARVYAYDHSCDELRPGDEITFTVKLRPATTRYGEETDTYLARGIGLLGTVKSPPERTGVWRWRWIYFPKAISHRLQSLAETLFPADVSAFAEALMLGEKRALYAENLDIPLKNAGIMHLAAVSGVQYRIFGFYRIARKPVNSALFGTRVSECREKMRFT